MVASGPARAACAVHERAKEETGEREESLPVRIAASTPEHTDARGLADGFVKFACACSARKLRGQSILVERTLRRRTSAATSTRCGSWCGICRPKRKNGRVCQHTTSKNQKTRKPNPMTSKSLRHNPLPISLLKNIPPAAPKKPPQRTKTHITAPRPTLLTPLPHFLPLTLRFTLILREHPIQHAALRPRSVQFYLRNQRIREMVQRPRGVLFVCGASTGGKESATGTWAARDLGREEGVEEKGEHCGGLFWGLVGCGLV